MDVGDGGKGGDGTADMYELRKERKQLFCGQRSTERSKELESASMKYQTVLENLMESL